MKKGSLSELPYIIHIWSSFGIAVPRWRFGLSRRTVVLNAPMAIVSLCNFGVKRGNRFVILAAAGNQIGSRFLILPEARRVWFRDWSSVINFRNLELMGSTLAEKTHRTDDRDRDINTAWGWIAWGMEVSRGLFHDDCGQAAVSSSREMCEARRPGYIRH